MSASRDAKCNTDHYLVHVKLRMNRTPSGKVNRCVKSRRFDVEKLRIQMKGRLLDMKRRV